MENYPFQKYIDEQKHLDTDEHRHLIKPIIHIINEDFKGEEHLYCDKSQLCPLGKYRKPKIIINNRGRKKRIQYNIRDGRIRQEGSRRQEAE